MGVRTAFDSFAAAVAKFDATGAGVDRLKAKIDQYKNNIRAEVAKLFKLLDEGKITADKILGELDRIKTAAESQRAAAEGALADFQALLYQDEKAAMDLALAVIEEVGKKLPAKLAAQREKLDAELAKRRLVYANRIDSMVDTAEKKAKADKKPFDLAKTREKVTAEVEAKDTKLQTMRQQLQDLKLSVTKKNAKYKKIGDELRAFLARTTAGRASKK